MIVTREWLSEWLDIDGISTDEICKSLNSIGLEVDSLSEHRIPKGVVVGYVKSCEKHPDADKLNVCQVDLGSKNVQIVCGAKNVAKGQFVPVATVGCVLGDDFTIKEAKLRGEDSFGMICASSEIGLPVTNDGIMVLDDSIGELVLGQNLCEYPLLNDDIIDIELTANRGDCLSVYGVARDLSSSLDRELKEIDKSFKDDKRGVSRVLKLDIKETPNCKVKQKFFEVKEYKMPLVMSYRLACIEEDSSDVMGRYLSYATQATGVLFRAYDFDKIQDEDKVELTLKTNSSDFDAVYVGDKELSVVGMNVDKDSESKNSKHVIVEASYIDPELISHKNSIKDIKSDDIFYRSSRGSEPDLEFGMNYLCSVCDTNFDLAIYAGSNDYDIELDIKIIKLDHNYINNFIGQDIDSSKIVQVLEHLRFGVRLEGDLFLIDVPAFRHDIVNRQDIIEELVRIIGIDNIKSKALNFTEKQNLSDTYITYKKSSYLRSKASSIGFFEAVHYFFDNKELMIKYNLPVVKEELDVTNPITNELNTLRTTLLLHLLNSSSRNMKFGKRSVKLFELGRVCDENRDEYKRLSFIYSGELEASSIDNHGKPESINFFKFAKMISQVVGEFELEEGTDKNALVSPYEYARVKVDGKDIGFIARVHIKVEKEFDLPNSYICEIDFEKIKYEKTIAKDYSKFPALSRDLSLIIPKDMKFSSIREFLKDEVPAEVISFAPIDIYESEELGDNLSLTVKFHIQSKDETLKEDQIVSIMNSILESLKEKFGIGIR
jgi:phenylalanyl-tRNA synthetase beta chain